MVFTPGYRRCSKLHFSAARKDKKFAITAPTFGMIGLHSGAFQVIIVNGIAAMTPAATAIHSAHLGPCVSQSEMQAITNIATTVSIIDHWNFPLKRRIIVMVSDPVAYMIGIDGFALCLIIVKADIQPSVDQSANVDRESPSPLPLIVETIRIPYETIPMNTLKYAKYFLFKSTPYLFEISLY